MLMVSSEMGSRPLGVILTVRREVFICGETAVMVPWRIVPVYYLGGLVRIIAQQTAVLEGTYRSSTQPSPSR